MDFAMSTQVFLDLLITQFHIRIQQKNLTPPSPSIYFTSLPNHPEHFIYGTFTYIYPKKLPSFLGKSASPASPSVGCPPSQCRCPKAASPRAALRSPWRRRPATRAVRPRRRGAFASPLGPALGEAATAAWRLQPRWATRNIPGVPYGFH